MFVISAILDINWFFFGIEKFKDEAEEMKKLVSEQAERLKELAQEGKTANEIAEQLNMKRSRVMMILRSYKVKPGKVSHSLECEKAQNIISELKKGTKQNKQIIT